MVFLTLESKLQGGKDALKGMVVNVLKIMSLLEASVLL